MAHGDDDPLWQDLREMWQTLDPPPDDLNAKVLAAIAVEDLDREYELLHLVESSAELAGTRAAGSDTSGLVRAMTIEFSHDEISVLLRVGGLDDGRRRIDGWIAPACGTAVVLRGDNRSWRAAIDESGRFEFGSLPPGRVRLWLEGAERSFTTTMFEI